MRSVVTGVAKALVEQVAERARGAASRPSAAGLSDSRGRVTRPPLGGCNDLMVTVAACVPKMLLQ
jgi:hypothetical protein